MIYTFTFILAFCSIAYELLLGQSLSAFLGNTVLRYSVTIGLYMLSMGIGAMLAEGRFVKRPVITLLKIELLLTVTGGFSVILLLVLNSAPLPGLIFFVMAHLLIIIIGVFTGFEIPLLMALKSIEKSNTESSVLGIDYLGAFFGTVVFAFLFYPKVGLIPTAFFVASLNALVGVCLFTQAEKVEEADRNGYRFLLLSQSALLIVMVGCLSTSGTINELFLRYYLGS